LLTRDAERGVEVAALDRAVGKSVGLIVGVFGSARLIGTPDTVVPASEDVGTVTGGRVVARGGRRDRVDQWLRDF
jgi:3-hydroxyacyl-CoA dehydrogenase